MSRKFVFLCALVSFSDILCASKDFGCWTFGRLSRKSEDDNKIFHRSYCQIKEKEKLEEANIFRKQKIEDIFKKNIQLKVEKSVWEKMINVLSSIEKNMQKSEMISASDQITDLCTQGVELFQGVVDEIQAILTEIQKNSQGSERFKVSDRTSRVNRTQSFQIQVNPRLSKDIRENPVQGIDDSRLQEISSILAPCLAKEISLLNEEGEEQKKEIKKLESQTIDLEQANKELQKKIVTLKGALEKMMNETQSSERIFSLLTNEKEKLHNQKNAPNGLIHSLRRSLSLRSRKSEVFPNAPQAFSYLSLRRRPRDSKAIPKDILAEDSLGGNNELGQH